MSALGAFASVVDSQLSEEQLAADVLHKLDLYDEASLERFGKGPLMGRRGRYGDEEEEEDDFDDDLDDDDDFDDDFEDDDDFDDDADDEEDDDDDFDDDEEELFN